MLLFGAITIYLSRIFATETKYELLQWDNVPEEIRQAPVQKIIFKNAR